MACRRAKLFRSAAQRREGGARQRWAAADRNSTLDRFATPAARGRNGERGRASDQYGAAAETRHAHAGRPRSSATPKAARRSTSCSSTRDGADAKGGDGGLNSLQTAPIARRPKRRAGRRAQKAQVELRVLADVGLLGMPNAGKSTRSRSILNANQDRRISFTRCTRNRRVRAAPDELRRRRIPGLIDAPPRRGGSTSVRALAAHALMLHLVDSRPST